MRTRALLRDAFGEEVDLKEEAEAEGVKEEEDRIFFFRVRRCSDNEVLLAAQNACAQACQVGSTRRVVSGYNSARIPSFGAPFRTRAPASTSSPP